MNDYLPMTGCGAHFPSAFQVPAVQTPNRSLGEHQPLLPGGRYSSTAGSSVYHGL